MLSDLNGPWDAQVVFVAEAPGRLGAELSGVPLAGDRTGDRFDELLAAMKWPRSEVFITNAILCNPRDENGNNGTPRRTEIVNCSAHLQRTIEMVNPRLVVAMGRVALEALTLIETHDCKLKTHAGRLVPWFGRTLAILYHPGPRTVVHRRWTDQVKDAVGVASQAKPILDSNRYQCRPSVPTSVPFGDLIQSPAI